MADAEGGRVRTCPGCAAELPDEVAALRAELAAARSKVAAATAVLVTSRNYFRTCAGTERHVAAIDALADQPAALTRTDSDLWHFNHRREDKQCDCVMCLTAEATAARLGAPTRTEADQRVLDAMANARISDPSDGFPVIASLHDEHALCRAELARRGLP